jgi:hypothetical protein
MPVTITEDPGISPNGGRTLSGSDSTKTPGPNGRIPIVATKFVSWATSHFADCTLDSQMDMVYKVSERFVFYIDFDGLFNFFDS